MAVSESGNSETSCETQESRKTVSTASSYFGKLGATASATSGALFRKVDSTRQRAQTTISGFATAAEGTVETVGRAAKQLAKSASSAADAVAGNPSDGNEETPLGRDFEYQTYRQRAEGFLVQEVADQELLWAANSTLQDAKSKSQFHPEVSSEGSQSTARTPAACMVSNGGALADMLQQISVRVAQQLQEAEKRAWKAEVELEKVREERGRLEKENAAYKRKLGEDAALAAVMQTAETDEEQRGLIDQLLNRISELESELKRRPLSFTPSTDSGSNALLQRAFNFTPGRSASIGSLGGSSSSSSGLGVGPKASARPPDPVPLLTCATQAAPQAVSSKAAARAKNATAGKAAAPRPSASSSHPPAGSSGAATSTCSGNAGITATMHPAANAAGFSLPAERETISVQVDRSSGATLGLEMHQTKEENAVTVLLVKPGNLVSAWNLQNPSSAVRPGDKIIRVNGHAGTAKELLERMKQNNILLLVLTRGTVEEAARARALLAERTRPRSPIAGKDAFAAPVRLDVQGAPLDGSEAAWRGDQPQRKSWSPAGCASSDCGGVARRVSTPAVVMEESSLASVPEEESGQENSSSADEHHQRQHTLRADRASATQGISAIGLGAATVSEEDEEDDEEEEKEEDEDEEEEECHNEAEQGSMPAAST